MGDRSTKRQRITPEERESIKAKFRAGASIQRVSKDTGRNPGTVGRIYWSMARRGEL